MINFQVLENINRVFVLTCVYQQIMSFLEYLCRGVMFACFIAQPVFYGRRKLETPSAHTNTRKIKMLISKILFKSFRGTKTMQNTNSKMFVLVKTRKLIASLYITVVESHDKLVTTARLAPLLSGTN